MHLITNGTSVFYLFHLALRLHGTLVDDSLDEFQTCCLALFRGMDSCEVHELNHQVVTIRRQEVDASTLLACFVHNHSQLAHGRTVGHTRLLSHIGHRVHLSEPHDVLNVDVVSDEPFLAFVGVDDTHQSFAVLPEEIEE